MLGDKLFMTTLDAHLLALDMKTGAIVWDATLEDYKIGYASTIAPIIVKDKVIVGVAGGEYGIRGFIDAYDAQTGKRAWRFYTIPGPGEPGFNTWAGDSWKIGGTGVWVTGAYDPELNLLFYGTGNPGPDYHSESREGDNLYSCSLVAHRCRHRQAPVALPVHAARRPRLGLDRSADPRRHHDQRPAAQGRDVRQPQRLLLHARSHQRKGHRRPSRSCTTTWAKEVDAQGRPMVLPGHTPDEKGETTCPDITGGTNFWPPSFDPRSDSSSSTPAKCAPPSTPTSRSTCAGERFTGGRSASSERPRQQAVFGAMRAIDPATGERKWEFLMPTPSGRAC